MTVQESSGKIMGRPPNLERKDELLDAVVDELQRSGFIANSLRSLAHKLGVTPNALLYHFGSKAALYSDAFSLMRSREVKRLTDSILSKPVIDFEQVIDSAWSEFSNPRMRGSTLSFFEVWVTSFREPENYREFLDHVVSDWISMAMLAKENLGLDDLELQGLATVVLGALRGMMLDLLTCGDEAIPRTDVAIQHLKLLARTLKRTANDD